jgi:hypothetical protein
MSSLFPIQSPEIRVCPGCGVPKPRTFEYFDRHPRMADGLASWCRDCRRTNTRECTFRHYHAFDGAAEKKAQRRRRALLSRLGLIAFVLCSAWNNAAGFTLPAHPPTASLPLPLNTHYLLFPFLAAWIALAVYKLRCDRLHAKERQARWDSKEFQESHPSYKKR